MEVVLRNVRLSFPDLFEAKSFDKEEPKYGASFLINKDDKANLDALRVAFEAVTKETFPNGAPKGLKKCINDGNQKEYEGYAGHWYISARSKKRPHIVHRDRSPITEADGIIYAGCYVNVSVNIWAQDNKYGQRINASLNGIQFVADGDRFGSSFDPNAAFAELPPQGEPVQSYETGANNVPDGDLPF